VLLDRGEVYYNDRKSALSADLHDLHFQSSFDPAETRYSGVLSYRDGHVHLQNTNRIVHNLEARFSATPQAFTLQQAVLTTESSRFALVASVRDYSQPPRLTRCLMPASSAAR
jgi:hypothetical protein